MDKLFFSVTSISTDFRYRFLSISYANISQLHFDTVGIAKLLSLSTILNPMLGTEKCSSVNKLPHSCNGFSHFHC